MHSKQLLPRKLILTESFETKRKETETEPWADAKLRKVYHSAVNPIADPIKLFFLRFPIFAV